MLARHDLYPMPPSKPPNLHLAPMAAQHVSAVVAIDELGHGHSWHLDTWFQELADPKRLHLVAIASTERSDEAGNGEFVVGHAGLIFLADVAHISNVGVAPEYQGQGIATRLLIELLKRARNLGAGSASLEVRVANKRAHRVYSRVGFQPLGVSESFYSKPREDALVMSIRYLDQPEVAERFAKVLAALP